MFFATRNESAGKPRDPDDRSAIRHCIIITAIGLAAITISAVLPRDEQASPRAPAQESARLAEKAPSNDSNGAEYYGPAIAPVQ